MIETDFEEILNCVACGKSGLVPTLDLGLQPLANDYLQEGSEFETYPLKLNYCKKCSHSQLSIAIKPSRLFRNYSYVSATSETLNDYFNSFSSMIFKVHGFSGKLLDIGSNDGSFLSKFKDTNWMSIGIDPAINLIPISNSLGVTTIPDFFTERLASLLTSDFNVIVAMNIFAHTSDPIGILRGIYNCLSENGAAYIQTSQADMFISGQFDTVYHEHISFFNVKSMKTLVNRSGLYLNDVTIVGIHGNSYLWKISKKPQNDVIFDRELFELGNGFNSEELYIKFKALALDKVKEVNLIIDKYRKQKFKIVAYGSAAKGNTFMNFAGIKLDLLFDDTPQKIGKMSPVGGAKVSNPMQLESIKEPLLIVIPAWNFATEILKKIRTLRKDSNDMYLTYFPETTIEKV